MMDHVTFQIAHLWVDQCYQVRKQIVLGTNVWESRRLAETLFIFILVGLTKWNL